VRFVFINRFYWPEEPATAQLLTDLAQALAAEGHKIVVITSRPGAGALRRELQGGVQIERVRSTRWAARRGLLGKAVDFASFYLGALLALARTANRGDIVVALTDPPLIGIGAWPVARLRGAKLVHWIQDIYPEIAVALTGHTWLGVVSPMRNLAWRRAEACVTLGTDMAGLIRAAGVKAHQLTVIPNWAPSGLTTQPATAAASLRDAWGLAGKFVVLYSGNLGRVHDLEPLLDVAHHLRAHAHIVLLFVGSGAQLAPLKAAAAQRGLNNVQFRPPQPRATLATSLALGDVHLVTLRPGCERSVFPSKLYGICAIGRPVFFVGPADCELARLVREGGFGRTFTRAATLDLAQNLSALAIAPVEREQLGRAAATFAARSGNATTAAQRWINLAAALDGA
jgi:glycosyltransferase involved in cell wall biosynthesis